MSDWPIVGLTTALVLITGYYAWQNKRTADQSARMVEEMRRQNRPYVYLAHDDDWLALRNDGNRSAHNVRLDILSDAEVRRVDQLIPYARVTMTQPGETPPPPPPAPTPEQRRAMTEGSVKVRDLVGAEGPIRAITPGGRKAIAKAGRYIGVRDRQRLAYVIRYSDGAGIEYHESLEIEYRI